MTDDRRPWITAEMAALASCADCDSDVTIVEDQPDVFTVRVRHDDNCPWYRAFCAVAPTRSGCTPGTSHDHRPRGPAHRPGSCA